MPSGRRSVPLTIILSSVSVALSLALVVGWILVIVRNRALAKEAVVSHAWLMAGGILSFIVIMTVLVLFTVFLVREIREVRRQSSFIDSVTHELKSPLASLKLCAETMARPELEAERREDLRKMMLVDVERLVSVIDGILEASRVRGGKTRVSLSEVELPTLAREAVAAVVRHHRLDPSRIRCEIADSLRFHSDAHALRIVIDNLLDNAIKYSSSEEPVELKAERRGDRVEIEIRDHGIGIPRRELKRVFERFYRVDDEAVRSRHGTGLGLFVVSALVRAMDGKVEARSEGVSKGSTMKVSLPYRSLHRGEDVAIERGSGQDVGR